MFTCHISLVFFSWQQFLSLSLTSMNLTLFKCTGQLFCNMLFTLGLSGVSSGVEMSCVPGEEYPRGNAVFSLHPLRWGTISGCAFPVNVDISHLFKVVLPSFSTVKLFSFPLVVNIYLMESYFEIM